MIRGSSKLGEQRKPGAFHCNKNLKMKKQQKKPLLGVDKHSNTNSIED